MTQVGSHSPTGAVSTYYYLVLVVVVECTLTCATVGSDVLLCRGQLEVNKNIHTGKRNERKDNSTSQGIRSTSYTCSVRARQQDTPSSTHEGIPSDDRHASPRWPCPDVGQNLPWRPMIAGQTMSLPCKVKQGGNHGCGSSGPIPNLLLRLFIPFPSLPRHSFCPLVFSLRSSPPAAANHTPHTTQYVTWLTPAHLPTII